MARSDTLYRGEDHHLGLGEHVILGERPCFWNLDGAEWKGGRSKMTLRLQS
jgi:hypothetical protein